MQRLSPRVTRCPFNVKCAQGQEYSQADSMIRLVKALSAWGTPVFTDALRQEITQLGADYLPLQQGLSTGNYVADKPITVVIHSVAELENVIRTRVGIFYNGVIGGCSCADDPTPSSEINEYCEVQLDIDKANAITMITLMT